MHGLTLAVHLHQCCPAVRSTQPPCACRLPAADGAALPCDRLPNRITRDGWQHGNVKGGGAYCYKFSLWQLDPFPSVGGA